MLFLMGMGCASAFGSNQVVQNRSADDSKSSIAVIPKRRKTGRPIVFRLFKSDFPGIASVLPGRAPKPRMVDPSETGMGQGSATRNNFDIPAAPRPLDF